MLSWIESFLYVVVVLILVEKTYHNTIVVVVSNNIDLQIKVVVCEINGIFFQNFSIRV